jgi:hypothetical protein
MKRKYTDFSLCYYSLAISYFMMWTPFCAQKANYEHAIQCKDTIACPYCGLCNPDKVISIPDDSPPARRSTAHTVSSRFLSLESTEGPTARQDAIARAQKEERPHAGSLIHSTRPKSSVATKGKLISVRRTFAVNIHLHVGDLLDPELMIYEDWQTIRES